MNKRYKTASTTLALLLASFPAFANNNVSYISDEAGAVILGVLTLLLLCTVSAIVIAAGNMRKKDRRLRRWSLILSFPLLIVGLVCVPFLPVVGLVLIAFEIPVWIMIFKSMPDNVSE